MDMITHMGLWWDSLSKTYTEYAHVHMYIYMYRERSVFIYIYVDIYALWYTFTQVWNITIYIGKSHYEWDLSGI